VRYDDDHFCPSCWDARSAAAPPRCKRPQAHSTARVVKVTTIFEDDKGGKTIIECDDFQWVEVDTHKTDPPVPWGYLQQPMMMSLDNELIVHIHRAKKYRVYPGDRPDPTPVLDDPNIVDADG